MSAPNPVVIDCCGANLASLGFALERLGVKAELTDDPTRIRHASHVILPGVGAARTAMKQLAASGLVPLLPGLTQPVLGICLGMQLLAQCSEENDAQCLGIIPTIVERLHSNEDRPVPHMGWNTLDIKTASSLLEGITQNSHVYFVHSYAVAIGPWTLATTHYGRPLSAVIQQGNFFGTQFHPERSGSPGARILENFLNL